MRWKLTLSYAGFLLLSWASFLVVMTFILRYVPDGDLSTATGGFVPDRTDLVRAGTPVVTAGTVALLILGLVGGWILAGHMLRPLKAISTAASAASRGSLSHRLEMAGPDDEFRRTADVFDEMLERLERSFDEQRRFTSNSSHELRTPLTASKTMLQVASAQNPDLDISTLLNRLQSMNDRSIATIEAMLRLAQMDHIVPKAEMCDLADVIRTCYRIVEGEATNLGVRVSEDLAAAPMVGDVALVEHLVTNLLLNAIRHNTSPVGHVHLRTRRGPRGAATLEIENSGPVLHPDVVATLTEPFVRGAGRTRSTTGSTGTGLGLTIASSIAELHRARLSLHPLAGGGLIARVEFAAARTDLSMSS